MRDGSVGLKLKTRHLLNPCLNILELVTTDFHFSIDFEQCQLIRLEYLHFSPGFPGL